MEMIFSETEFLQCHTIFTEEASQFDILFRRRLF